MSRVLLIEDNEDNVVLFAFLLEREGFHVTVANTGKAGIELARQATADVILLDIQLPDMDGMEVLEVIRHQANKDDVPIVVVTALAMPGDRERMLTAGCNAYIEKPIDVTTFASEVKRILEGNLST